VELADTSVWVVSRQPGQVELRAWFDDAVEEGQIATCDMVRLELLYTARNEREFDDLREGLAALPGSPIGKPQWERALEVYRGLAAQGGTHQRSVRHADLLIAAAAESAELTLVHYDEDFDRIAAITGQPTRWAVPRGTA
jgi:predicted nucleic acid-binding protein